MYIHMCSINRQPVTADDLPVQAGSHILYILQFLGTAMLQQPEYVNELSSGCRQSLRVISSSFTALFVANLCCLCETCPAFPSLIMSVIVNKKVIIIIIVILIIVVISGTLQMSLAILMCCNTVSHSSLFAVSVDNC